MALLIIPNAFVCSLASKTLDDTTTRFPFSVHKSHHNRHRQKKRAFSVQQPFPLVSRPGAQAAMAKKVSKDKSPLGDVVEKVHANCLHVFFVRSFYIIIFFACDSFVQVKPPT